VITTETQLKRSTVGRIIKESVRGRDFLNNRKLYRKSAGDHYAESAQI
jgi:hypothetical protein